MDAEQQGLKEIYHARRQDTAELGAKAMQAIVLEIIDRFMSGSAELVASGNLHAHTTNKVLGILRSTIAETPTSLAAYRAIP